MTNESNVVYIGNKPAMNYVLAVLTDFNTPHIKDVTLKARGRAISRAVDVAEISRHRFFNDLRVKNISIGSEELPAREENRTRTVSTIELTLTRIPIEEESKDESKKKVIKTIPKGIELVSIAGIGEITAQKLKSGGIHSIQDLAESNPAILSKKLKLSEVWLSRWIEEAKKLLE
jgi:DNA-binding protein Alba